MCGLVGVFGANEGLAPIKMFNKMLFLDTVRGRHSTGVIRVNKSNEVATIKEAVTGEMFLDMKRSQDFLALKEKPVALLGHNRAATVGAVNRNNAHPFSHNGVHLSHNGTLRNERDLDSYFDHEVDSEMLCDDISRNGLKETLEKVDGAFALTWVDEADGTINIVRNSERPLWICTVSNTDSRGKPIGVPWVAYASEPWMLDAPVWSQGLTYVEKPVIVPKLTWMKFDIEGVKAAKTHKDYVECMTQEKVKEAPYQYNNWGSSYRGSKTTECTKSSASTPISTSTPVNKVHESDKHMTTVVFVPSGTTMLGSEDGSSTRYYLNGLTAKGSRVKCAVDQPTYNLFIENKIAEITCKKLCIENSDSGKLQQIRCTAMGNIFSYKTKVQKDLPVKKN